MADTKIGTVSHYYNKIGVAIIEVEKKLSVGDKIKFVHKGEDLFEETVESIEYEHKKIDSAKKGDSVGLKVTQPVKEGAEVFKVKE